MEMELLQFALQRESRKTPANSQTISKLARLYTTEKVIQFWTGLELLKLTLSSSVAILASEIQDLVLAKDVGIWLSI